MKYSVFWFRRDLRLDDNAGLYHALQSGIPIRPIFIFDSNILSQLARNDARVTFIYDALLDLDGTLQTYGSCLEVYSGDPVSIWKELAKDDNLQDVYCNRDYEPYAKSRDQRVASLLHAANIGFHDFKDHVVFDREEIMKKDGSPYTVFTPYKKMWLQRIESGRSSPMDDSCFLSSFPSVDHLSGLEQRGSNCLITLEDLGFARSAIAAPDKTVSQGLIKNYDQTRDFPAVEGTSKLGVHFRFGTISIRSKARKAVTLNQTYLSELIWRDFYSMILDHFPHVEHSSFRSKYDAIPWRNDEEEFEAWKRGETGYPLVDAGMRELNATGYMHNRVRMLVASFLTKHLLIDWRWGEAYFAEHLLDFDLASNNGGWQWAAGCGTDAAPYFRIFNPYTQQSKFDKDGVYTTRWVPEWKGDAYVDPIVDHKYARMRCLETYKSVLS